MSILCKSTKNRGNGNTATAPDPDLKCRIGSERPAGILRNGAIVAPERLFRLRHSSARTAPASDHGIELRYISRMSAGRPQIRGRRDSEALIEICPYPSKKQAKDCICDYLCLYCKCLVQVTAFIHPSHILTHKP